MGIVTLSSVPDIGISYLQGILKNGLRGSPKAVGRRGERNHQIMADLEKVLEMLVDRGYAISADELTISRDKFQHDYCDKQTGIADRRMMRLQAVPTPEMIK